MRTRSEDYIVGWICAIGIERVVACAILDEEFTRDKGPWIDKTRDQNSYTFGCIHGHNVVIAALPQGRYGITSAAIVAKDMQASFPALEIRLMVGIAGAAPSERNDIRLGDIVVSTPTSVYGGVIQYDFGKNLQMHDFKMTGHLAAPTNNLLNALTHLRAQHDSTGHHIATQLTDMLQRNPNLKASCSRPQLGKDRLYKAEYDHSDYEQCHCQSPSDGLLSGNSETSFLVSRPERADGPESIAIHYGLIGSANQVMKDANIRDAIAEKYGILCFEMEAAGLMNIFPAVVIRGICDYSDSHKNNAWQGYAAANAAAYAKELLGILSVKSNKDPASPPKPQRSAVKPRYVIPFPENRRFVGREAKLAELQRRLLIDRDTQQLAIFGLGGVGKTQLALAFAHAVKAQDPDRSIFWVSALSIARFKQDYTKIAKAFGLKTNENDVISVVKDYLSGPETEKWFLIVDNVDDKDFLFNEDNDSIANNLPYSECGITLFTTRHKEIAVDIADGELVSLEEMDVEEAELFFTKMLRDKELVQDVGAMRELLEELTYLPLAIAQAASYIVKTSITIPRYLALTRDTENELIKLLSRDFRDNTRETSRNAVAVTWLVSFEQIKKDNPVAADLLFFIALIENKAIPISILNHSQAISSGDLVHAIGILLGYSFLTKQGDEDVYDMHRLVHRAVKIWMEQQCVVEEWKHKTMRHLAGIFPWNLWKHRSLWQEYIPHATRALKNTKDTPSVERAELCIRVGRVLGTEGRTRESVAWISECVAYRKDWLSEDNTSRLIAEHELAAGYLDNGQTNLAIEILEKVVEIRDRVHAEIHPHRLASQHTCASAYIEGGRVEQAAKMLEKVVAIKEKLLLEEDRSRLVSQHELARAYLLIGKVPDAVKILEKVVATKKRVLAEDHPHRLASEHELAGAYMSCGRHTEAISLMQYVVHIRGKSLSLIHPDRQNSENGLATMLQYRSEV